jgi:hypothetical protein
MFKRPKISKEEMVADAIYISVSMLVSALAIFIFDIHQSFYPGQSILPPSRFIFQSMTPYLIGIPIGGIIGFFILKLVSFAFIEDEKAHEKEKARKRK